MGKDRLCFSGLWRVRSVAWRAQLVLQKASVRQISRAPTTMETYTPLRSKGILPVPNDWTFKCMPRWKRALVIRSAYAASEAAYAASLSYQASREEEQQVAVRADGLVGAALDAAVRQAAAASLASTVRKEAVARSAAGRERAARSWRTALQKPVRVTLEKGGQRSVVSRWPAQCSVELERLLRGQGCSGGFALRDVRRGNYEVVVAFDGARPRPDDSKV